MLSMSGAHHPFMLSPSPVTGQLLGDTWFKQYQVLRIPLTIRSGLSWDTDPLVVSGVGPSSIVSHWVELPVLKAHAKGAVLPPTSSTPNLSGEGC